MKELQFTIYSTGRKSTCPNDDANSPSRECGEGKFTGQYLYSNIALIKKSIDSDNYRAAIEGLIDNSS